MNVGKFLYVIAGLMHLACFSFATNQLSSPKIRGEDTSFTNLQIIQKSQTNERKLNSLCKIFAFNGGVGTNPLRDTDDYSATDGSGQSLLQYCSLNDCCTGGSGQECRHWSPNTHVMYEMCPSSCHGHDSCTGIASDSAAGTVVSIQSGSCHGEGSCHRIAQSSPRVLNVRIEENSCLGQDSCQGIGAENESNLANVQIGPFSCTKDFSCDSAGDGTNSQTAFHAGVIIPEEECNSEIGSCRYCAQDTLFMGTVVIKESCCSAVSDEEQYQHFDTACHETNAPSISVMPSNSPVPSSSPSLSIKPSLSTMPSTRFKPSVLPSLYPSSIPSKQIDCTAVTHYYPDAGMDTPQSDLGSLSPLIDHACSDPDQNYIVEENVYKYGLTCCIFDYDTQQCGIWENYSARGGDGGFLHPCSFGPIDASEEPINPHLSSSASSHHCYLRHLQVLLRAIFHRQVQVQAANLHQVKAWNLFKCRRLLQA